MSLSSHIEELSGKHQALEAQIDHELARPINDSLMIAALKKRKLLIKEKIERLKAPNHASR